MIHSIELSFSFTFVLFDSPGTRVEWGEGCEASRQLRGSQKDKTLQPPAWDTNTALEKLYWATLEPSAFWVRVRPDADQSVEEEEDDDEDREELLPAWAIRDFSS